MRIAHHALTKINSLIHVLVDAKCKTERLKYTLTLAVENG